MTVKKSEGAFALKVSSKYTLSREVVNEIFSFSENIHSLKLDVILAQLKLDFGNESNVKIEDVIERVEILDSMIGLKDKLSTHYKREKELERQFNFIEPQRMPIADSETHFYYYMPVLETLGRLLSDDSVRDHIIHQPTFDKPDVCQCFKLLLIKSCMIYRNQFRVISFVII